MFAPPVNSLQDPAASVHQHNTQQYRNRAHQKAGLQQSVYAAQASGKNVTVAQAAVNDMVAHTSTELAPWTLVAGNDKRSARVQILKTVCARLEAAL